jgi:hypothetical protein
MVTGGGPLKLAGSQHGLASDMAELYEEVKNSESAVNGDDGKEDVKDNINVDGDKNQHSLCDFTFIVSGQRLPCHRAILAARSPVFRAMVSKAANTAEAATGEATVTDATPAAMRKLIEFMYTDKVESMGESTADLADLFAAADKYGLAELNKLTERALAERFSTDNVADVLMLAYLHEAAWLKDRAMEFVRENMATVCETDGWKNILKSHPKILHEILIKEFGQKPQVQVNVAASSAAVNAELKVSAPSTSNPQGPSSFNFLR